MNPGPSNPTESKDEKTRSCCLLLSLLISTAFFGQKTASASVGGSRGCPDLAREHAEKAMAILDAQTVPASSGTDTEEYRGEIRRSVQQTLKKLGEKQG